MVFYQKRSEMGGIKMKSRLSFVKKSIALGLAATMTVVTCISQVPQKIEAATANDGVTKEENVYVIADAQGTVNQVIVSDWLKNENNSAVIVDKSNLDNIQNVKGDETFTQDDGKITWNAGGNDIFYRGTSSEKLPVGVTLTYKLDGEEVTPQDIKGKSGKLEVTVNYTNETAQTSGDYIPFIMLTGMMLDSDHYSNVEVENGKFISDGDKNIVIGYGIPGIEDQVDLDIDAMDHVTVTADVTDFDSLITMSVATNELFDLDDIDTSKVDELKDGVETLKDGMDTLSSKTGDFVDGMDTLSEKSEALVSGTKKLANGTKKFSVNMGTLNRQVKKLSSGISGLTKQLTKLNKGAKQLSTGSKDAKAGTKAVSEALKTISGGLSELNTNFPLITKGVSTINDSCDQMVGTLTAINQGAQGVGSYLTKEVQLNNQDAAELSALMEKASTISDPTLKAEVMQIVQDLMVSNATQTQVVSNAAILASNVTTGTTGVIAGVGLLKGKLTDPEEGLIAGMKKAQGAVSSLSKGTSELYKKSKELDAGMKKINDGAATLYKSINGKMPEINSMVKKIPTLTKGVKKLYDASKTIMKGNAQLSQKSGTLVKGINKLDTASGKLLKGIQKINDGTDELYDGVQKIVNALDSVTQSKQYDTFSGLGEGMSHKTRFIFKTE